MSPFLALISGTLAACGTALLLSRNMLRILFGIIALSNAANVFLFAIGGVGSRLAPIMARGPKSWQGRRRTRCRRP